MSDHRMLKTETKVKLDALQASVPRWVAHATCKDHEVAFDGDQRRALWRPGGYCRGPLHHYPVGHSGTHCHQWRPRPPSLSRLKNFAADISLILDVKK